MLIDPDDRMMQPDLWTVQKLICKHCKRQFTHEADGVLVKRNAALCPECDRWFRERHRAFGENLNGDLPPDMDRSTGGARAVSRVGVRPKFTGEVPDERS